MKMQKLTFTVTTNGSGCTLSPAETLGQHEIYMCFYYHSTAVPPRIAAEAAANPKTRADTFINLLKHGPTPRNTAKANRSQTINVLTLLAETHPEYMLPAKLQ